jgi:hypothetical protein
MTFLAETFLADCSKALKGLPAADPTSTLNAKQINTESEDNSDDVEEALNFIIRSYKATQNLNRFGGMVRTSHHNVHVSVNMGKVRAFMSQLDEKEVVTLSDGGCDITLLGAGWYILEYTGRCEKKSRLC